MSKDEPAKCIAGCFLLALGSGCVAAGGGSATETHVRSMLQDQAASWNAGNIEAFMQPYWQSAELTFSSGGKVTRGWEPTRANYHVRYPTRELMGHLTFSDLEVTDLGGKAALVLGRWHLEREEPVGGAFSLVMRKIDDQWVIIHDHTSRDQP